jgi:hypothetical protein
VKEAVIVYAPESNKKAEMLANGEKKMGYKELMQ